MVTNNSDLKKETGKFIQNYIEMRVLGKIFSCPYWSNNLNKNREILRGYLNGKGDAESIRSKLEKLITLEANANSILSENDIFRKFARRNRIGIDCSGFVYRVLDFVIKSGKANSKISSLENVYSSAIERTNAKKLTSKRYNYAIKKSGDAKFADLIRINGGSHVAFIMENTINKITYVHSSFKLSNERGVHYGQIRIRSKDKGLEFQEWLEKTGKNENFGKKFFHAKKGDGIYRLKIFGKNNE